MAELSERLHVLISGEQSEELKRLSEVSGKPVGQLVREALDQTYRAARPSGPLLALSRLEEQGYIKEESWMAIAEGLEGLR